MKEIGKGYQLLEFETPMDILRRYTNRLVLELKKNEYTSVMTNRDTNSYVIYRGKKLVGSIHFNLMSAYDEDLVRSLSEYSRKERALRAKGYIPFEELMQKVGKGKIPKSEVKSHEWEFTEIGTYVRPQGKLERMLH